MAADYIPTSDSGKLAWLRNFAHQLSSRRASYMVSQADVDAIRRAVDEYAEAYTAAVAPSSRTQGVVRSKDNCRDAAVRMCRLYAMQIKLNAGISDQRKIVAGIRPVNSGRSAISVPMSSPAIAVLAATQNAHTLIYKDTLNPDRRAKPYGATHLQLFVHIGDSPDVGPNQARFYGAFTRSPMVVLFEHADSGKYASYFARWSSRRGEVGPWSASVYMRIAA